MICIKRASPGIGRFPFRAALPGLFALVAGVEASELSDSADRLQAQTDARVVEWRRDIHEHPELGNRELRTSALVAEHLRSLGLEVRTGIAHTGVVGLLRGARATPVVALRADMDALPVTEQVDLPFASRVRSTYLGREVGVMHACGHDNHVAMLMGVAEVLARMRERLPGTVKFIFQPAEEGAPPGEEGGAELMVAEGVLDDPAVDAIFGLHVGSSPLGTIGYRSGPVMASADSFTIVVSGVQTHGAAPWAGVDPIVAASQIVLGLQTITSRQVDLRVSPAVVTVGSIEGGVRHNIVPDRVEMRGTIRTFDEEMRRDIHARITRTAETIARSSGASAEVAIDEGVPVTSNDPELAARMVPVLERTFGDDRLVEMRMTTTAEDFAFYQQQVPGFFFFLGVADPDDPNPAPNHSPYFRADERALPVGVRALIHLTLGYLAGE